MNRNEEYYNLLQELEQPVPELEHTIDRARRKQKRRQRVIRPFVTIASSFVIFVGLVNLSAPVATVCSKIPFLAELTKAVNFSNSLSDAVANDYVQSISLAQTDGDVTATIEYAIVDEKQINIFFRLDSDVYPNLKALPQESPIDEESPFISSCTANDWMVPNGELQSITIDSIKGEIPDRLRLQLSVLDMDRTNDEVVAQFDFTLEFDPAYAETSARRYPIDKTLTINNQTITVTDMEVYPTHIRLNVSEDPNNTAWLCGLDFQILTDSDIKYVPPFAGTKAILNRNSGEQPYCCSFFAESTYFESSKHYEIQIKGAEWETKKTEELIVNLETGEGEQLADQITVFHFAKEPDGWLIEFLRNSQHTYQSIAATFYDEKGTAYSLASWESTDIGYKTVHFFETTPPEGHSFEKMSLHIIHRYEKDAEEPITIQVK